MVIIILKTDYDPKGNEHVHFVDIPHDLDKVLANGKTLETMLKDDIALNTDKTGWKKSLYDIDSISIEMLNTARLTKTECNKWRQSSGLSEIP